MHTHTHTHCVSLSVLDSALSQHSLRALHLRALRAVLIALSWSESLLGCRPLHALGLLANQFILSWRKRVLASVRCKSELQRNPLFISVTDCMLWSYLFSMVADILQVRSSSSAAAHRSCHGHSCACWLLLRLLLARAHI